MSARKNTLVIIENGHLEKYDLDDKLRWDIGRLTQESTPDIRLSTSTVSRRHGVFENTDGYWFYYDCNGKNGTVYNGKHIMPRRGGRVSPVELEHGDVLIFGGADEAVINSKTVWSVFLQNSYSELWAVEDTKDIEEVSFKSGSQTRTFSKPEKGMIVEFENGIAIYMGDITYLSGDVSVIV